MNKVFKIFCILGAGIALAINMILKNMPQRVEKLYSNGINKAVVQILSRITNIFPFSLAEILFILLVIILIYFVIKLVISIKKGGTIGVVINIASYLSVLYILFLLLWGINYDRPSFDKIVGLKIEKASEENLVKLCEALIDKANMLRLRVNENSNGVMTIPGGYKDIFKRESIGYEIAAKKIPQLGGKYGSPKPIFLSQPMLYTGITGIFMPYTGEANVNVKEVDMMLPCTTAHEMAHQRGFAREDEANYIAYVVCTMHPDADFQYSGVMLALINSMNALGNIDYKTYEKLEVKYSIGVKKDLQYNNEFWSKYEGSIEKAADKVNDTYIKSNGQEAGVQSYGKMVDLLLAEFKYNQINNKSIY